MKLAAKQSPHHRIILLNKKGPRIKRGPGGKVKLNRYSIFCVFCLKRLTFQTRSFNQINQQY